MIRGSEKTVNRVFKRGVKRQVVATPIFGVLRLMFGSIGSNADANWSNNADLGPRGSFKIEGGLMFCPNARVPPQGTIALATLEMLGLVGNRRRKAVEAAPGG